MYRGNVVLCKRGDWHCLQNNLWKSNESKLKIQKKGLRGGIYPRQKYIHTKIRIYTTQIYIYNIYNTKLLRGVGSVVHDKCQ